METVKLKPFIANYIWGGHRLCPVYGLDGETIAAEAWVFSAHPDGPSTVDSGECRGSSLREYLAELGDGVFGSGARLEPGFGAPILCKFIDAARTLSIQVHPDDAFARKHENSPGKSEMWYILDAEPGAFIYYGLRRDVTREELARSMEDGSVTELLNKVYVKPGDAFFIPAGTIHAIGAGIFICEIQQSSNITYRMYDFGRLGADGKPRPLHIEKAAACAKITASGVSQEKKAIPCDGAGAELLAECEYFRAVRYTVGKGGRTALDAAESFLSVIVTGGSGRLETPEAGFDLGFGDSFFVPAGTGEVTVESDSGCELIVSSNGNG